MKRKILALVVLAILAFTAVLVGNDQPPVFKGATEFTASINTERALRDLEPLQNSALLDFAAQVKCNDMATRGYIGHQDPEGDYVWKDLEENYKYGENIGIGFYSSYDTVQAWKDSPTHYQNIIDPVYDEVGHFTCYAGDKYLTVQVFKGN